MGVPYRSFISVFVLLFVALFFTGCVGETRVGNEAYAVGSEGISVDFLDTRTVYFDEDYMRLQMLVHNKGAYDRPSGKLTLSGFDRSIVRIAEDPLLLPVLEGKDAYYPNGYSDFLEVYEDAPLQLTLGESYSTNVQANVCYRYQTVATPTVCIVYNPLDMNICKPRTLSLGTQGAPVAIRQVNTELMKDKVRFVAVVENVGNGVVVNPIDAASYLYCPYQLQREHVNTLAFTMEINGLGEPDCSPSGKIVTLNEGIGVLSCTFTLRGQDTYTTPLKITLDYDYMDSFSTPITVQSRYGGSRDVQRSSGSSGSVSPVGNGCYCSEANKRIWGGCVCLKIDGQNHICAEGTNPIPVSVKPGELISYEVVGNNVVACGDSANPTQACPFKGQTPVKRLSIYGKTADGRTVSERCNLVSSV